MPDYVTLLFIVWLVAFIGGPLLYYVYQCGRRAGRKERHVRYVEANDLIFRDDDYV